METKTFSAGERRGELAAPGVGTGLQSLPGSLLSARSSLRDLHDLYTFFSSDQSSKIRNLKKKKKKFLCKRLLWMTAKLSSLSPEVLLGMI